MSSFRQSILQIAAIEDVKDEVFIALVCARSVGIAVVLTDPIAAIAGVRAG